MEAKSDSQTQPQEEQQYERPEEEGKLDDTAYESEGPSAIDKQYAAQTGTPRRIHIIGATGSIGKLIAHSLRGIPNPPPVTLLLHRYKLIQAWEKGRKCVTLEDDGHETPRQGYDVELMPERRMQHDVEFGFNEPGVYDMGDDVKPHDAAQMIKEQRGTESDVRKGNERDMEKDGLITKVPGLKGDKYMSDEPIHNLIVTVKAARTLQALNTIKHRILPTSTICFLQNGMGVVDDVNKEVFPDEASRPHYMQGILTHGANVPPAKAEQDPFYVVHAGHGTIALGLIPPKRSSPSSDTDSTAKEAQNKMAPSSRYLFRTLTRSPVLCAVGFTPTELLQQQLEKLAVNSVINPLTALIDNRNGALLYNFAFTRTIRLLLAETSHVIRSLPELQGIPNVGIRFSPERLEGLVVKLATTTKDNISSMLADVRAGRKTEIEYINGYIVRRGEELGVKCVVNYSVMQMVVGKSQMIYREGREDVPREGEMGLE